MTTPLQQDVCDAMEALGSVDELMLLRGRLRTKTGNDLANEAYDERTTLVNQIAKLKALAESLSEEVDGLRAQNEMMTDREVAG